MKTLLAVSSDTHAASRVGLCPPVFTIQTTEGGPMECHASPGQLAMWEAWNTNWHKMRLLADALSAELVAIHLGDGADDANGKNAGLVSSNKNDILAIGRAVDAPMVEAADRLYMARGTEFHVGEQSWLDEEIARTSGAVPSPEGLSSWWVIRLVIGGLRIHAAHHPPSRGFTPWTEQSAASSSSSKLRMRYAEMDEPPPDLAFFGHVHFLGDSGVATKPRVLFCPGWQMMTSFGARIGLAGLARPVGAWYAIIEDGHYTLEPELYKWKKESVWSTS